MITGPSMPTCRPVVTGMPGSVGAAALAASPAPIATASGIFFSQSGTIVAFIGIVAMLSAMNAYIVGTSRVIHTISARFSVPVLQDLTRQETHFAFGRNWAEFAEKISAAEIGEADRGLARDPRLEDRGITHSGKTA